MKTLTLAVIAFAQAAWAGIICPPGYHEECGGEPYLCSCVFDGPPPQICTPGDWRACPADPHCGSDHEQQCGLSGYAWGPCTCSARQAIQDRIYHNLDDRSGGHTFGADHYRRRMTPNYVYLQPMAGPNPVAEIRVFASDFYRRIDTFQILYLSYNYKVTINSLGTCGPSGCFDYGVTIHDNNTGAEVAYAWEHGTGRMVMAGDPTVVPGAQPALNMMRASIDDIGGRQELLWEASTYTIDDHTRGLNDNPPGMDDPMHTDPETQVAGTFVGGAIGCYDEDGMCADEYFICVPNCDEDGTDPSGEPYSGIYPHGGGSTTVGCDLADPIDKLSLGWTRHEATWESRKKADEACRTADCAGCCGWIGIDGTAHAGGDPDPTCACVGGDVLCICNVTGFGCRPYP
jgi:hypothetical protein